MKLIHIIGLLAVLVLVAAQGCQKTEVPIIKPKVVVLREQETREEAPTGADVRILKSGFDPETITIKAGSVVILKNIDESPHIVIIGDERSPRMEKGDVWDKRFDEPGTYELVDAIAKFSGVVIVE